MSQDYRIEIQKENELMTKQKGAWVLVKMACEIELSPEQMVEIEDGARLQDVVDLSHIKTEPMWVDDFEILEYV